MERNKLHKEMSDLVKNCLPVDCELTRDKACGGDQQIPLFFLNSKSRETEYCKVDLLVLKKSEEKLDEIRAIIEIEKSNIKPTQICGKFLTSALAKCYIHKKKKFVPIEMHNPTTFIQIVDSSGLKEDKTAKFDQWENLEESIQKLLPIPDSRVKNYWLLYLDKRKNSQNKLTKLCSILNEACT